MRAFRPSPRGTTIIEAMAAMLVFVVGILGVMQMNVLASGQNNLALHQTTASRIARDLADAFERLPYQHAAFVDSEMSLDTFGQPGGFDDMENTTKLIFLKNVIAPAGERPLISAADAIRVAEGLNAQTQEEFYTVAWRSVLVPNTGEIESERGKKDSLRILIMVRFPTTGGFRQINFWTIKYVPDQVCSGTQCNDLEI
ncbi:type IV pilus modification PilV family protein [Stigmatella aurantiaca]|uniref:Type IV pilus assembly protein PilV n=1 Tax=Stigmatella aurantiaca (strain DW4/3-1) TaxID=378806 RepID=E3FHI3_STIAD|nr:hypothetical protein [Stigmatella aurantiaca]ADO69055.1 uncharacterized protein STAUR_1251 [Stigmatella aurantiaca DW4/3-1]